MGERGGKKKGCECKDIIIIVSMKVVIFWACVYLCLHVHGDLLILTLTNVWEFVFEPVSLQETHGYSSIVFCTNLMTYKFQTPHGQVYAFSMN
jgi:hypothetical protein